MKWGSNLEPRASKEDALSTPTPLPGPIYFSYSHCISNCFKERPKNLFQALLAHPGQDFDPAGPDSGEGPDLALLEERGALKGLSEEDHPPAPHPNARHLSHSSRGGVAK